jgi:hypothetical protein
MTYDFPARNSNFGPHDASRFTPNDKENDKEKDKEKET